MAPGQSLRSTGTSHPHRDGIGEVIGAVAGAVIGGAIEVSQIKGTDPIDGWKIAGATPGRAGGYRRCHIRRCRRGRGHSMLEYSVLSVSERSRAASARRPCAVRTLG